MKFHDKFSVGLCLLGWGSMDVFENFELSNSLRTLGAILFVRIWWNAFIEEYAKNSNHAVALNDHALLPLISPPTSHNLTSNKDQISA